MQITAEEHVSQRAAEFVDGVPSAALDYSEESLGRVTAVLLGMAEMFPDGQFPAPLVEDASSYVLEVARREFGGVFKYHEPTQQLVLVTGMPDYEVSTTGKTKVVGLLSGDQADDLAFHYAGFAQRARLAKPGDVDVRLSTMQGATPPPVCGRSRDVTSSTSSIWSIYGW